MNEEFASKCLSELGSPTRLAAYRLLVRAGPDGMVMGELQRRLGVPASTLSHHVARLSWAGLVEQRRDGRHLYCFSRNDVMHALVAFLSDECCLGFADEQPDAPAA